MTHLLINTIAVLIDVTVVISTAPVRLAYRFAKIPACWLPDFVTDSEPRISIAEIRAVQQLEADVAASDDGFSCPVLWKTDSQAL